MAPQCYAPSPLPPGPHSLDSAPPFALASLLARTPVGMLVNLHKKLVDCARIKASTVSKSNKL
jgi:hypothetical protein